MLVAAPVFFSFFVLIFASSQTNESELGGKMLQEKSLKGERKAPVPKSDNIPIVQGETPKENAEFLSFSYNSYPERVIFSPKHIETVKSPISQPGFIDMLRGIQASGDESSLEAAIATPSRRKVKGSESSELDESSSSSDESKISSQDDGLMFDIEDLDKF